MEKRKMAKYKVRTMAQDTVEVIAERMELDGNFVTFKKYNNRTPGEDIVAYFTHVVSVIRED
jgi:hypothetical protein